MAESKAAPTESDPKFIVRVKKDPSDVLPNKVRLIIMTDGIQVHSPKKRLMTWPWKNIKSWQNDFKRLRISFEVMAVNTKKFKVFTFKTEDVRKLEACVRRTVEARSRPLQNNKAAPPAAAAAAAAPPAGGTATAAPDKWIAGVVMSDPTGRLPSEVVLHIGNEGVRVFSKTHLDDARRRRAEGEVRPVIVWMYTNIMRWTSGDAEITLDLSQPRVAVKFGVSAPGTVAAALLAKTTLAAAVSRRASSVSAPPPPQPAPGRSASVAAAPARPRSVSAGPKAFPGTVVTDPSASLPAHVTISVSDTGVRVTAVGSRTGFKWGFRELTRWGAGGGAGGAVLSLWVVNPNGGPPVEFSFKTSYAAMVVTQIQAKVDATLHAPSPRDRQLAEVGRQQLVGAAAPPPPPPAAAAAAPPPSGPMVACPKCRTALAIPGGKKGTKAMCPKCGQKFRI